MNKKINSRNGDDSGTIDSLIKYLEEAKGQGATHYGMTWSKDPVWAFKWFETYKKQTEEESINEEIASLKNKLCE